MKYAVISDVHLGQTNKDGSYSLLSLSASNNRKYRNHVSETLKLFKKELVSFKGDDELSLIVLGDYLDLSMGNNYYAYEDHHQLLNQICADSLLIVVGNHDHHLWTSQQLIKKELRALQYNSLPDRGSVFDLDYPSSMYQFSVSERGSSKKVSSHLYYPSLKLKLGDNTFCLTHGHLFGGLYTTISKLLDEYLKDVPLTEALLASVNAPLIEAIYWLLGQIGSPIGTQGFVSAVYNSVLEGKTSLVNQLVDDAVEMLLPRGLIKGIPDKFEKWVVKKVVKSVLKKVVKDASAPYSKNRHEENDATLRSVKRWINDVYKLDDEAVVISGHTHKICDGEWINTDDKKFHYFNTGTWLVEPNHQNPSALMFKIDNDGTYSTKIFNL